MKLYETSSELLENYTIHCIEQKLSEDTALLTSVFTGETKEVKALLGQKKLFKVAYLNLALILSIDLAIRETESKISADNHQAAPITKLLIEKKANPECKIPFWNPPTTIIDFALNINHSGLIQTLYNSKRINIIPNQIYLDRFQSAIYPNFKLFAAWHTYALTAQMHLKPILFQLGLRKGYFVDKHTAYSSEWLTYQAIEGDVSILYFLQAVSRLLITQRREPKISAALLRWLPLVLAKITMAYSDDITETPENLTRQIISAMDCGQPLEQTDPDPEWVHLDNRNSDKIKLREKEFQKAVKTDPNQEWTIEAKFSCPILMYAAGIGAADTVRCLLNSKTDPTVSVSGNSALIWALRGKNGKAAAYLLEALENQNWKRYSMGDCTIM